jgi:acetate kinase
MQSAEDTLLAINAGSSSIKFALYEQKGLKPLFYGEMENIGDVNAQLNFTNALSNQSRQFDVGGSDRKTLIRFLADWLNMQEGFNRVTAIGHRLVQGMQYQRPEKITDQLLLALKKITAYDPEHIPGEIEIIEIFVKNFPKVEQVACFDTDFHHTMPKIAALLPIPRRYFEKGIRRYGFHGLSYAYLLEELSALTNPKTANGKIIIAHLGNGASVAAIEHRKSKDCSMGFTPNSGLPMGTRSGDIDPGFLYYLMQEEKLSPQKINALLNHESGLLGISETSSNMRELLKKQDTDSRASEAIALFCYQTKKCIGAYAAALGGIDTLIFSGGIGEHTPQIRTQICDTLKFLGIEIDENKNKNNADIISLPDAKVTIRVMHTNEELMIAKLVYEYLNTNNKNKS